MKLDNASACLESLGNSTRLAIYRALVRAGPPGMPVGKLQARLDVPGSTLSHHIAHLVKNDLVSQTREGRVLRCTANYRTMNDLISYLSDECCQDTRSRA